MALIYIVEDDESIREIETIALKNSNYIVSAFENAKEFYKKLDELVPDLIPVSYTHLDVYKRQIYICI